MISTMGAPDAAGPILPLGSHFGVDGVGCIISPTNTDAQEQKAGTTNPGWRLEGRLTLAGRPKDAYGRRGLLPSEKGSDESAYKRGANPWVGTNFNPYVKPRRDHASMEGTGTIGLEPGSPLEVEVPTWARFN